MVHKTTHAMTEMPNNKYEQNLEQLAVHLKEESRLSVLTLRRKHY